MDVSRMETAPTDTPRTQSHSGGWWAMQIISWIVSAPFWYFTFAVLWTGGGWIAVLPGLLALFTVGFGNKMAEGLDRR